MDGSPFVRLPPELRSQIFELVLTHGEIELCDRTKYSQLLCTCSQFRNEASPIFYGSNVFYHSFRRDRHPVRTDIVSLVQHLKTLGPMAVGSMKVLFIHWRQFSVEYSRAHPVIAVHRQDGLCPPGPPLDPRDLEYMSRHFRPGHVESEIIDLYRLMGLSVRFGVGRGSWIVAPPSAQSNHSVSKLDFWTEMWDAEAETLRDAEYWKRDPARQLLGMLCRHPSVAEYLDKEGQL